MRLQKITFPGRPDLTRFAGSQKDASATRRELADTFNVGVRSGVIEQIEVNSNKEGLLDFLNQALEEAASGAKASA
jgi:hypothetical protein